MITIQTTEMFPTHEVRLIVIKNFHYWKHVLKLHFKSNGKIFTLQNFFN